MKIDYLIDGKSVDIDTVTDKAKKTAIRVATNFVIERIQDIKDPDTGLTPQVTIVDKPRDGLSFEIEGSDSLREQVEKALYSA